MLTDLVGKELKLKKSEPRSFLVSVSGGLDSTVLLHILYKLSQNFPIDLNVLHINFQLRGKESDRDEKFVKDFASSLKLNSVVRKIKIKEKSHIQEAARNARIKVAASIQPDAELIEAHHADDQVETFMFRLLRGTGLNGLSCMKVESIREGRRVMRPLLKVSKLELRKYANENRIPFREDSSNKEDNYDRNWIRNKLLTLIVGRYPKSKEAILRLVDQIQEEEDELAIHYGDLEAAIIKSHNPLLWDWDAAKSLSASTLNRFLHYFFKKYYRLNLSRTQIIEVSKKVKAEKRFSANWPKKVVVKGQPSSRTRKAAEVLFLNLPK